MRSSMYGTSYYDTMVRTARAGLRQTRAHRLSRAPVTLTILRGFWGHLQLKTRYWIRAALP